GAVAGGAGPLGELQGEDVLAPDRLADGDDLGEVAVALCGAEELLLETALAAVRAEHALGGLLHAVGRAGREPVLGEPHTLRLALVGLSGGEVDLDGGGAPVGDLLTEFVAVLARG